MKDRSSIVVGAILIFLGLFFMVAEFADFDLGEHWPLIIIGVGVLFLLGALRGQPPMAVPAAIIGGTGILLYYQSLSDDWESWAYAWTLYPGLVGIGVMLMHLFQGERAQAWRQGGLLISISLVLFIIFGSFLGGWAIAGWLWPLALIGLGVLLLVRSLLAR